LDLVGEQDRDPIYAAKIWRALQDPILRGRVRVRGRVSPEELLCRFAEADALLLTSTYEGYGMVLAEALAAGLPIVATRAGAIPEVVRDREEAELVPPGDAGALARAIARLASDPSERRRRARRARERAAGLPRWSESIAAFDRILSNVTVVAG
jgi:glycosyltransferase involved in cell wall biosynthesis